MIWIAEEPFPITATFLPEKSYDSSQAAEWMSLPLNLSKPSMSGHFQLLRWLVSSISLKEDIL